MRPRGAGDGGHIRLGWGGCEDGVRVAAWPTGKLVVPTEMLDRAERAERLVGHADAHRDTVARVLRLWLRPLRLPSLRRETRRLWLRRHAVAYAAEVLGDVRPLWARWVGSRPADLYPSLSDARRWMRAQGYARQEEHLAWWLLCWARKDRHLRQWAADARVGFVNARDALFRETALRLAAEHDTWAVDDYSIADLKKLPELVRSGDVVIPVAQHHLQLAAPGRLREILLDVLGDRCTPRERSRGDDDPGSARTARNHDRSDGSPAAEAAAQPPA